MGEDWWRDLLHLTQKHHPDVASFICRIAAQYQAGEIDPTNPSSESDLAQFHRVFEPLIKPHQ